MKKQLLIVLLIALLVFGLNAFAATDYAFGKETETTTQGGNPPTTPSTTPGGGAGGGEGAVTTETVLEKTLSATISAEELAAILEAAGYSVEQIEAAKALEGEAEITQTVKVEKITSASGVVSYKTTVTITINNPTGMNWKEVKVVVEIPKAIASSASEITSLLSFLTLKEDPILQFTVDIPTGTSKTITWSIAKNISSSVLDTIKAPIIASLIEETPAINKCLGVNCDDGNPCTTDNCDSATGNCSHNIVADETVCGAGMVCKAGSCVIKPTGAVTVPSAGLPLWAIAIIVIIIIIVLYYFLVMKKKK